MLKLLSYNNTYFSVDIIQVEYVFLTLKMDPNCNKILPVTNKMISIFSPCKSEFCFRLNVDISEKIPD